MMTLRPRCASIALPFATLEPIPDGLAIAVVAPDEGRIRCALALREASEPACVVVVSLSLAVRGDAVELSSGRFVLGGAAVAARVE